MNLKIPSYEYSLYDTGYGNDIPYEQLFVVNFNMLPSVYRLSKNTYSPEIIDLLINKGFEKIILQEYSDRTEISTNIGFVNEEKQQMVHLTSYRTVKRDLLYSLKIYYNLFKGSINEQFDFDEINKLEKKKDKSNISLITSSNGHLDTEDFDLPIPSIDVEMNYGVNFKPVHDTIISNLNKDHGKGIILLHGDPGTGKSNYLKYLTSLINDKDVLFIPPSMAESLSEPSIIPFLMEHKNSILIIEDAERVISDREINGSSAGVSNILNLTDGILGDCLSIQIIATFNMKREKIDQALLRKGRLVAEHKFEKLNVEDTNKLLRHLNFDYISDVPMSLADIYNVDVEVHKTITKTKLGF